ncbi:hypothetical protein LOZ61_002194 [Ophidiomyces ophidiicola]|nr:hypothetical protein LOZ61_002194 [Ophidiomyces ophidiicola]KAI2127079.1 hypothetical protein LOZ31_002941 [Ophidiomyces ophidiicola]KAI2148225.1 hypothetical protein LOZ27_001887 [Ophidiomyces ophidiicola]KAI2152571.1 hypothetical protein LOZ25_005712 [Ophidiomyces ophidiicola]KAI2206977.1 hypothetical protein LOZ16_004450 [Ophidiomyces ophidiicola]
MFHKGDSHKCDPCRNSNEVHDKRHREVARLIQKLRQLDAGEPACSPLSAELKTDTTDDDEKENAFRQEDYAYMVPGSPKTPIRKPSVLKVPGAPRKSFGGTPAEQIRRHLLEQKTQSAEKGFSEAKSLAVDSQQIPVVCEGPKQERLPAHIWSNKAAGSSHRLSMSYRPSGLSNVYTSDPVPISNSNTKVIDNSSETPQKLAAWKDSVVLDVVESSEGAQGMSITESVTDTESTGKGRRPSQLAKIKREEKKALKHAKSVNKALRRQSMSCSTIIITSEEIEKVNHAIHGISRSQACLSLEQTIKVFIGHIATQTRLDRETSHIKISYDAVGDQKYEALLAERLKLRFVKETLARLDIQPVIAKSTKERRVLVFKIIEAIFLDIKYLANEAHETPKRAGGYWLYANKRAYRNMVENNKEVDWETGEKIQFEDEESDLE